MPVENITLRWFFVSKSATDTNLNPVVQSVNIVLNEHNLPDVWKQLPEDCIDDGFIWLTISKTDGAVLAFVDGIEPSAPVVPEDRRGLRISGEYAEALRSQAKLFEERRIQKRKEMLYRKP